MNIDEDKNPQQKLQSKPCNIWVITNDRSAPKTEMRARGCILFELFPSKVIGLQEKHLFRNQRSIGGRTGRDNWLSLICWWNFREPSVACSLGEITSEWPWALCPKHGFRQKETIWTGYALRHLVMRKEWSSGKITHLAKDFYRGRGERGPILTILQRQGS